LLTWIQPSDLIVFSGLLCLCRKRYFRSSSKYLPNRLGFQSLIQIFFLHSFSAHYSALLSRYLAKICSINLDLEVVVRYATAKFCVLLQKDLSLIIPASGGSRHSSWNPFPGISLLPGRGFARCQPTYARFHFAKVQILSSHNHSLFIFAAFSFNPL